MMTLYGFKVVDPKVIGVTRDLRAQWALEETGTPYRVEGLDDLTGELKDPAYRRINPFEQIPAIDHDGFIVTESAAIVLYIAETAGKLLPLDRQGRTRVVQWCFCAMNTIEPPLLDIAIIDLFGDANAATLERRSQLVDTANRWLRVLDSRLENTSSIAGADFSVADILVTCVLREVRKSEVLRPFTHLNRYIAQCQERPAWQRTLQMYESRLGVTPGTAS
jgi:glutathione S-transferase